MLKKHGAYTKYYYDESIIILRCICKNCKRTHAVIPSFSLPGTSIGTKEAETYLEQREEGVGKWKAGKVFFEKGMKANYVLGFEKAFQTVLDRAKAIFSASGDSSLTGTSWIQSLTGESTNPILSLNQYCLEHGVNAICITRFSIHLFTTKSEGIKVPHNIGNRSDRKVFIDSW